MKRELFPQTITIRVPYFVTQLVAAEVYKRSFLKSNGQGNENTFFNKMLPNMLSYRAYKKGFLRDYLDKSIKESIAEGMQEKILDFLAESFDYLYFNENEYECDDVITIRFDVRNEDLYADLFVRLDNLGIKRSAYLRNLIHEYFNQSEYQKERICYNEEFNKLRNAIANQEIVQFNINGEAVSACVVALEYSVKKEHWFLLYFKENCFDFLYSVPIYDVKKLANRQLRYSDPPSEVIEFINDVLESGCFDESDKFIIGDV